jgi:hypothetical protein
MRVRAAVIWAILLGCGGARDGGGAAAVTSQVTTPPSAGPATSSTSATPPSPGGGPSATPGGSVDTEPPDNTPTPAPSPFPATSHAWAGTQVFTPWTEIDGVATLPGGGLIVYGSQLVTNNGIGSRHGTLAWTDASGNVERVLEVPQADEIFSMAVSASSRAIALAGYTQGTGGYLLLLDADGALQWLVSMGREVAVYGVTFAPNGDVVACGSPSCLTNSSRSGFQTSCSSELTNTPRTSPNTREASRSLAQR